MHARSRRRSKHTHGDLSAPRMHIRQSIPSYLCHSFPSHLPYAATVPSDFCHHSFLVNFLPRPTTCRDVTSSRGRQFYGYCVLIFYPCIPTTTTSSSISFRRAGTHSPLPDSPGCYIWEQLNRISLRSQSKRRPTPGRTQVTRSCLRTEIP